METDKPFDFAFAGRGWYKYNYGKPLPTDPRTKVCILYIYEMLPPATYLHSYFYAESVSETCNTGLAEIMGWCLFKP
jgi:hypothetical protein